jgi:hypothetical protein
MKKKGTGMVMTIMLVSICGWVAIVVFVIKPDIGDGIALSVIGGTAIGVVIVCLMSKWWFKGIRWPDPSRVTRDKEFNIGSRFQPGPYNYRYACAGEELKAGTMVEAGRVLNGQGIPVGRELIELIYGDVKAAHQVDKHGTNLLGWPTVNVKRGRHFWIQEPPMGAEFEKEGEKR